jgi:hypothetical protein
MDFLEFECPLCKGLFSAVATDVEVACPHCDETICLGDFDFGAATNVVLVAKPTSTPAPLFPPGYKKQSETAAATSVDSKLVTPPAPLTEETIPVVIINDDADETVDDTQTVAPPANVTEETIPVVIINDDADETVDDTQTVVPPANVPEETMPVVIINDDADGLSTETDSACCPPVTASCDTDKSPNIIASLADAESDSAIDDLLPPVFQLDDGQIETATNGRETVETRRDPPVIASGDTNRAVTAAGAVVIDVRVDAEPATVGQGGNKRELRSRTADEKSQFVRKKNLIVWGIGALIIIVTMIVMLQLT